jgi:hypothetical protein
VNPTVRRIQKCLDPYLLPMMIVSGLVLVWLTVTRGYHPLCAFAAGCMVLFGVSDALYRYVKRRIDRLKRAGL